MYNQQRIGSVNRTGYNDPSLQSSLLACLGFIDATWIAAQKGSEKNAHMWNLISASVALTFYKIDFLIIWLNFIVRPPKLIGVPIPRNALYAEKCSISILIITTLGLTYERVLYAICSTKLFRQTCTMEMMCSRIFHWIMTDNRDGKPWTWNEIQELEHDQSSRFFFWHNFHFHKYFHDMKRIDNCYEINLRTWVETTFHRQSVDFLHLHEVMHEQTVVTALLF